MNKTIKIWTDGGFRSSVNIGAWAYIILKDENFTRLEDYDVAYNTTNNIQELTAVIKALETIESTNVPIVVHSDSKYVVEGITSWRHNWTANNWKTSSNQPVANKELWQQLIKLVDKQDYFIKFQWVKGHQNNGGMNDEVDQLVNDAMDTHLKYQEKCSNNTEEGKTTSNDNLTAFKQNLKNLQKSHGIFINSVHNISKISDFPYITLTDKHGVVLWEGFDD